MAVESKLQRKIIKELEKAGWYVVKMVMTNKNGIPDIVSIKSGSYIWVEVKAPGEKARKLQEFRHQQLRDHGASVYVIDSMEDLQAVIKQHK